MSGSFCNREVCPLLAHGGRATRADECLLLAAKRTWTGAGGGGLSNMGWGLPTLADHVSPNPVVGTTVGTAVTGA
jgi:hypothetical protein